MVMSACSRQLLNALHHFRYNIEQGVEKRIAVYAERKLKLEEALEHAQAGVDVAAAILASLQEQLVTAQLKFTEDDNDQNRGEVRCCESGIKCAQKRLSCEK
jgi:hypothetical protein